MGHLRRLFPQWLRHMHSNPAACMKYTSFPFSSAGSLDIVHIKSFVSRAGSCKKAHQKSQTPVWQPSQADVDAKPWKYLGYRSFSAFVASDNDLFILRRFSALSARVLLGLQDRLSRLEEDLEMLEKTAREKDAPDNHNGSFRQETQEDRQDIICQAQRLLREYSQPWFFYSAFNETRFLGLHSP